MDAAPGLCDTHPMSGAANTILLAAGLIHFAAAYRLGWTAGVDLDQLPPPRRMVIPRLRRLYYASLGLAFLSCAAMAAHIALRDVVDAGPSETQVALWAGLALLAVALWSVAQSGRGR